jgi:hypothetical protein
MIKFFNMFVVFLLWIQMAIELILLPKVLATKGDAPVDADSKLMISWFILRLCLASYLVYIIIQL